MPDLTHAARRAAKRLLDRAGLRIARHEGGLPAALSRMIAAGMTPTTVLDVGAAYGDWSVEVKQSVPKARFVLFEPVAEYRPIIEAALQGTDYVLIEAAAADATGTMSINVHDDLVGSSLLRETEGGTVDGTPREIDTTTLDDAVALLDLDVPLLIKVDVQGAELRVLRGSEKAIADAVGVVLEVSFLDYFEDGARFDEVVEFMADRGFVIYDIFGFQRRPLDGSLGQTDVLFVKSDAPVRRKRGYASSADRRAQNEMFRAEYQRRLREAIPR